MGEIKRCRRCARYIYHRTWPSNFDDICKCTPLEVRHGHNTDSPGETDCPVGCVMVGEESVA